VYLVSGIIGLAITRFKHRGVTPPAAVHQPEVTHRDSAAR